MADDNSLLGMLEGSGLQVRAYDLGRRIARLDPVRLRAFEQAREPYPTPMQHKAWLALAHTSDATPDQPVIWFLRLDLDEQGLLVQAGRDYLLRRLLESAQARSTGADPQAFLQDNPYAFKPREDRMALFHALLSVELGLPASRFYAHALDYFSGGPGWDQWGFVGYQGIADVACRHHDKPLTAALPRLPREPLIALCHCLESQPLGEPLSEALANRLRRALADEPADTPLIAALVRGLSFGREPVARGAAVDAVLGHPAAVDIEVLAAIAGRAWETLLDADRLRRFVDRLAANGRGQTAFEHGIRDLLSLPELAVPLRDTLRGARIGSAAREAFARMVSSTDAVPE